MIPEFVVWIIKGLPHHIVKKEGLKITVCEEKPVPLASSISILENNNFIFRTSSPGLDSLIRREVLSFAEDLKNTHGLR